MATDHRDAKWETDFTSMAWEARECKDGWARIFSVKSGEDFGGRSVSIGPPLPILLAKDYVRLHNAALDTKAEPSTQFWYTREDNHGSLVQIFTNPPHKKPFFRKGEWFSMHKHGVHNGIFMTVEQFEALWPGLYVPSYGEGPFPVGQQPTFDAKAQPEPQPAISREELEKLVLQELKQRVEVTGIHDAKRAIADILVTRLENHAVHVPVEGRL